jgi:nucleoside-diphosphate-sugar epimerase
MYYASSGEGMKLSEVCGMIGESLGRRKTWTVHFPPLSLFAVSTFYEIKKLLTKKNVPYDWSKAAESKNDWYCSSRKAEEQLNFKAKSTIKERIQETTNWYKENKWL